jgi:hypothetical protein
MDKQPARHDRTHNQRERHDEQPTWRRTAPRGNQEIHRPDMERSTERLEMLLGH